jgi:hypothetical protein
MGEMFPHGDAEVVSVKGSAGVASTLFDFVQDGRTQVLPLMHLHAPRFILGKQCLYLPYLNQTTCTKQKISTASWTSSPSLPFTEW